MVQAKCIEKLRDQSGKILGYRLQDNNGQIKAVESKELKRAITNQKINITNLILTSDGRLVDASIERNDTDKLLAYSPEEINDWLEGIVKKCANKICQGLYGKDAVEIIVGAPFAGCVVGQFELENVVYMGIPRALEIIIDINRDTQQMWIVLIDEYINLRDAEKRIKLSPDFINNTKHNMEMINDFVNTYINYIKQIKEN